ncbi:MAG: DUF2282 domain-containing protein [Chromatiaceae bacterium]|nr:DUF2282 domain-containing protein [Chromatiaceae bacterium]MBP6735614.1 DUF2282 domain-containing protein [Chromatiaceae bacterium]
MTSVRTTGPPVRPPCAGTSTKDYPGNAWKLVPKDRCATTASPTSPTGHGQLAAFKEKS